MLLKAADVRLTRADTMTCREKATESSVDFIRRQVETTKPVNKAELVVGIWTLYWDMFDAGMLACPYNTRCLLRKIYGSWKAVGVASKYPAGTLAAARADVAAAA